MNRRTLALSAMWCLSTMLACANSSPDAPEPEERTAEGVATETAALLPVEPPVAMPGELPVEPPVAAAAAATVEVPDEADGEGSGARAVALPFVGGGGGHVYRQVCPPGSFAVGMRGDARLVVDAVELLCLSVEPVEQPTPPGAVRPVQSMGRAGRAAGDPALSFEQVCAPDHVMLGAQGGAGSVVDSLQVACGAITDVRSGVQVPPELLGRAGGDGGDRYSAMCPAGSVVVGVQGGAGALVDSLQVLCAGLDDVAAGRELPDGLEPSHVRAPPDAPRSWDEIGYLGVSSSPRGSVWVDGVYTGQRTPLRRYPLPTGPHEIRVEYGFEQTEASSEVKLVLIRSQVLTNVFFRQP